MTLSIESCCRSVSEASAKRIECVDFLERDYFGYFSKTVATVREEHGSRELLSLLTHPDREDAGALTNFVTYSRRFKDKPVNLAALDTVEPLQAAEFSAHPEA